MVNIFGYEMPDYAGRHYEKFIKYKQIYLETKTTDASADMKFAYEDIYEDFKLEMHKKNISENDFYKCKKLLNEGL